MSKSNSSGRGGLSLSLAVVALLLILDWFYGSVTRPLLLGQADVVIETQPPGAQVLADTQVLGTTPLRDGRVLPGEYVIRVEHPHYEPIRERVQLKRGDALSRTHKLLPATGKLELVSNPRGAAILLDGVLQAESTPATFADLRAGVYEVELRLEGRKTARSKIDVQRDGTYEFNAELNRIPMARLTLDLTPADAAVELLEIDKPYSAGMLLEPATYAVRVTREGYAPEESRLELRRGPNRIAVQLVRQQGVLSVQVSPRAAQVSIRTENGEHPFSNTMNLPTGTVRLSASLSGYRRLQRTIQLTPEGANVTLDLKRYNVAPGRVFRDPLTSGGEAPAMVELAAGSFIMGNPNDQAAADERPAHRVALAAPFAMSVYEVTRSEWATQFGAVESEEDGQLPITNVSLEQIQSYLSWLGQQTGKRYRLPSEAEWEYAARGGQRSEFGVTNVRSQLCRFANVADSTMQKTFGDWDAVGCADGYVRLAPVGSFAANDFGLFDMIGNANERLADCWHGSYKGAPADGRVWGRRCAAWVSRGGAWDTAASDLRVSFRNRVLRKDKELGLRLVREL